MKFSDKSHHVQLSIWDALESASVRPLDTDFAMLLVRVDESLASLPISERLSAAGDAIACLGAIYGERCAVRLAEIDYLNHPDWEPCLSLDAFDCYIRQSMMVDLEQFIETPDLPEYEREYNLTVVRERVNAEILAEIEAAEEIDPEVAYRTAMALAHDENVSEWGAAIAMKLDECNRSVLLMELQQSVEMPLVQVWLGLLLNGFEIEQRGEFYQTEQVWILR
jgi:hypothetical protein